MKSSTLRLKHEKGWFAAGAEVENALMTLSDGAFKLFVHLCLLAPRATGLIQASQSELALNLKKGNYTIRKYLREMEQAGVCRLSGFAPLPYSRGPIEITDEYWPYHRRETPPTSPAVQESVDQVRRLLQDRPCVRASFSSAGLTRRATEAPPRQRTLCSTVRRPGGTPLAGRATPHQGE